METNSSTASPDGHPIEAPPTSTTAEQVPPPGDDPGVEGDAGAEAEAVEASEVIDEDALPDGELQAALDGDAEVHGTAT